MTDLAAHFLITGVIRLKLTILWVRDAFAPPIKDNFAFPHFCFVI
jgi:hypothetical protein